MSETASAPTRSRSRNQREVRVEAIVDTATELFCARGFRGTTVAAVAAQVGLTDAGVLHHFPTKRALLMAVLDRSQRAHAKRFKELLASGGLEALRKLGSWGEVMEEQPHLMGLQISLSTEALDPDSELHEYFTDRYRILRRWIIQVIEEAIDADELRPDVDAAYEAAACIAYMDGLRLQWFFDSSTSLSDGVRTYVAQFISRAST